LLLIWSWLWFELVSIYHVLWTIPSTSLRKSFSRKTGRK
jgi:hypothetical protein